MKTDLRVALVQMEIADGDSAKNVARAKAMIDEHAGAQLYLLPELWTSGYVHPQWPSLAKRTSDVLKELARVAGRHDTVIGGTLISENDARHLVNRFWLVGKNGVLGCYDKAHLFPPMGEPAHLTPGSARSRVALGPWTAALSICYDLRFPEMYLRDAVDGANLFLVSSEWPAERGDAMRALAVARAIETQGFVAVTNRVGVAADGTQFGGGSLVAGPGGEVLVSAGGSETVVTADLDLPRIAAARGARPHFTQRQAGIDW